MSVRSGPDVSKAITWMPFRLIWRRNVSGLSLLSRIRSLQFFSARCLMRGLTREKDG